MNEKANYFFIKNSIRPDNIKYLIREERKTVLYLLDGSRPYTNMPLKEVLTALPEDKFLNIQKGIAVAAGQIIDISDLGVYTMTDGRTFQGRRRSLREHKDNRRMLGISDGAPSVSSTGMTLVEKCTVYNNSPIAVCLIELVADAGGALIDFVFRYCNPQMERLEGVPVDQMLGRTIREVFPRANYKKLIAYADVALNGTSRIAESYSFVNNEPQKVYCYQPEEGFCICVIAKETTFNKKEVLKPQ